jgi:hypothetical protein
MKYKLPILKLPGLPNIIEMYGVYLFSKPGFQKISMMNKIMRKVLCLIDGIIYGYKTKRSRVFCRILIMFCNPELQKELD